VEQSFQPLFGYLVVTVAPERESVPMTDEYEELLE
jgi:hypothetical protein